MSIDALIAGRIARDPQARTASNGRRYVTTLVRAAIRDGNGLFVSVIAFSDSACDALLALDDGDSVAIAGELTPTVYFPKDGSDPRPSLDLVAHRVLSEYHVARKRKAMTDSKAPRNADRATDDRAADVPPPAGADPEMDDELPF